MEHMMLLVTYRMLPGQRDAFLQEVAAAGILAKGQQQAHVNTDHMAQLRAIKEKHVASTAMQRIAKAD